MLALPSKVATNVLKLVGFSISSYYQLVKRYHDSTNSSVIYKPRLPKYLHKTKGRCVVEFTNQTIIDQDEIPIYGNIKTKPSFSGERISRGSYKTKEGFLLNADINGSYNILVKGLASLGKVLDRSLVSFHTRSLADSGTQSNLDLIAQYM